MNNHVNTPEDWPDPIPEGRGLSIDVSILIDGTKKPVVGYFDYNTMQWVSLGGENLLKGFKWINI